IEAVVHALERRVVHRAAFGTRLDPPARRTAVGLAHRPFAEEQGRDLAVRARGQGVLPAGDPSALGPRDRLAPAVEQLALRPSTRLYEQRTHELEQLGRRRVRLGLHAPDDLRASVGRQELREARRRLLRPDQDEGTLAAAAELRLHARRDVAEVLLNEVLDVA